jgi:hypothetical protein
MRAPRTSGPRRSRQKVALTSNPTSAAPPARALTRTCAADPPRRSTATSRSSGPGWIGVQKIAVAEPSRSSSSPSARAAARNAAVVSTPPDGSAKFHWVPTSSR